MGTDRRIAGRDVLLRGAGVAGAGRTTGAGCSGVDETGATGGGATGSAARIGGSILGMHPDRSRPAPIMRPMASDLRFNPVSPQTVQR